MKPWMMAAFMGGATLVTETFTFSQTWTAPATKSINLSGKGVNGTSTTIMNASNGIVQVNYRTDTNLGTGNVTWDNFTAYTSNTLSDFNADGVATFNYVEYDVWPDGRNRLVQQYQVSINNGVPGSGSINSNLGTSGPITYSGSASFSWQYYGPGQAGAASSMTGPNGFSRTFPGGAVGQSAPTTTFNDIAVTPGQQFQLIVPNGGSITISYYL